MSRHPIRLCTPNHSSQLDAYGPMTYERPSEGSNATGGRTGLQGLRLAWAYGAQRATRHFTILVGAKLEA